MSTIPLSKYEELQRELAQANSRIKELEKQESSSYFSDSSIPNSETEEGPRQKRKKYKKKRPKSKASSLRKILRQHQEILTKLGNINTQNTEESNEIKALVNSLGNTNLKEALKDDDNTNPFAAEMIQPPDVAKNPNASSATLRETLQSLRDCFKTTFSGKEEEDLESYFMTAGKLAENHKLSKSQFYTLIRSRVLMGSNLYIEIGGHEYQRSSLKTMYQEILYTYGRQRNYVRTLHSLNSFKPTHNMQPNEVFTRVKALVIQLATTSKTEDMTSFIYSRLKEKMLSLYPEISQQVVEQEYRDRTQTTANFTRIFLSLAPLNIKKTNKGKDDTVLEIEEDPPTDDERGNNENNKVHIVRLNESVVKRLAGKCYKCASTTHFGRDCPVYKGCALAYYICNKCKLSVHLPKDCKMSAEDINLVYHEDNVRIQVVQENQPSESKNVE